MYKAVDHADEAAVAAWVVLGSSPGDHRHHSVVVQVQECHLLVFLTQNEEYLKHVRYWP